MGIECELPPLRSLDDFILGSARFQVPTYQDLEKWGNRVTKNFLYYQTNYFLMGIIVSTVFALCKPAQTIFGLTAIGIVIGAIIFINPNQIQGHANDGLTRWIYLFGITLIIGVILHWFESILYVALLILLPFCLAFLHASFRLRNLKNKLSNVIDERLRCTPMGMFLEALNIIADSVSK